MDNFDDHKNLYLFEQEKVLNEGSINCTARQFDTRGIPTIYRNEKENRK